MTESSNSTTGFYAGHRVNGGEPVLAETLLSRDDAITKAYETSERVVTKLDALGLADPQVEAVIVPVIITVSEAKGAAELVTEDMLPAVNADSRDFVDEL